VHRAIKPKAVFVASGSGSDAGGGVQLSGAGWYRRLIDLNKAEPWVVQPAEEDLPESWCGQFARLPRTRAD